MYQSHFNRSVAGMIQAGSIGSCAAPNFLDTW